MDKLYSTPDILDAHVLKDLLEDAGIRVLIKNEQLSAVMVEAPINQLIPEVWVTDPQQLEAAQVVLAEYLERKAAPDGPDRRCSACGEESPSNFEVCWKCRRPF